jgi:hypothetical protein
MILFLDFDGVMHPDSVFVTRKGPKLHGEGQLFMWMPILETELTKFPAVELVLSTSWVRHIGFARAKRRLSMELQSRVVGATWHSSMANTWADQVWWDQATRYGQIMRYVSRANIASWLALDDDVEGWAQSNHHRLIHSDGGRGLSDELTAQDLRTKLTAAFAS